MALVTTGVAPARPASAAVAVPAPAAVAAPAATAGARHRPVWQPKGFLEWQWELDHPLSLHSARDMGLDTRAYNGDRPPRTVPKVYDIDAVLNPASTIAALHRRGDRAICYVDVGTAGNYYTAAQEGIPRTYFAQLRADGDLGHELQGYPEYFIDITARSAVRIVESMIARQCARKHFDAVETDLDETFGTNEGVTGFHITVADELHYLETLAGYMHARGLAWFAKNLDDTGRPAFVDALAPYAQGVITEQCNQFHTCSLLRPFLAAHKPVLDAEYYLPPGRFCPADNAAGISGARFPLSLAGGRLPCR